MGQTVYLPQDYPVLILMNPLGLSGVNPSEEAQGEWIAFNTLARFDMVVSTKLLLPWYLFTHITVIHSIISYRFDTVLHQHME